MSERAEKQGSVESEGKVGEGKCKWIIQVRKRSWKEREEGGRWELRGKGTRRSKNRRRETNKRDKKT